MGLILIAAIIFVIGGRVCMQKYMKKPSMFVDLVEIAVIVIVAISSMTLFFLGITGVCLGESEYVLKETKELVGIKQGDSTYAFLDDENSCYYVNGERIKVFNNDGTDENISCKIVIGDYESIYVEKYDIDYKMNFFTFNLVNGKEYKVYIPQNMVSE